MTSRNGTPIDNAPPGVAGRGRRAGGGDPPSGSRLVNLARRRRRAVAYSAYAGATAAAFLIAYATRFDLQVPGEYQAVMWIQFAALVSLRLLAARTFRLLDARWRYVGIDDALRLVGAAAVSSAVFVLLFRGVPTPGPGVPYSVVLIEWAVFTVSVGGVWILYRRAAEHMGALHGRNGEPAPRNVVIVGSGDAGNLLAREIRRTPGPYRAIGFLDDDPLKAGTRVQGLPVLGPTAYARQLLDGLAVDEVVIAIPSAGPSELRGILERLDPLEIPFKVLPGIGQVIEGEDRIHQLRSLRIEDLLGREPVSLELPELQADLEGKVVLVTGAAGSIGSELSRQIAANRPGRLILLDQAESDLYFVDLELRSAHPRLEIVTLIGDILDQVRIAEVFQDHAPDRVYHAAAYKHVPLMESNPREAVRNNVLGTWQVARLAGEHGLGRFVLISTDKAADPASVMGAAKRASEMVMQELQEEYPNTHYVGVRFGNVLGSNGSVIPLFQRQIAVGGPLTITHPEVTRYFMTIPEAVQLVLQAGLLPEARGRIAMLEMGEPVKIVDLARNLVRLQGLRPEVDIPFEYTGLRPGEKLHETLSGPDEELAPTSLDAVGIVRSATAAPGEGGLAHTLADYDRRRAVMKKECLDWLEDFVLVSCRPGANEVPRARVHAARVHGPQPRPASRGAFAT